MEPQFSNGSVPQPNRSIGTGEGESPLAVQSQPISMRTMNSDTSSIKTNGGGVPAPYVSMNTPAPAPVAPTFTPPPMDTQGPVPMPTTPVSGSTPIVTAQTESSSKGLVVAIVSFLIVLGVAAAGYFFIYPMFAKIDTSAVVPTPPVVDVPVTPVDQPTEPVPEIPAVTETSTPTSTPSSTPSSFLKTHVSLFKVSADASSEISLTGIDGAAYRSAVPSPTADVPVVKEVIFRTAEGIVPQTAFLAGIAPKTFASGTTALFNPDFTFFTYTNASGTWPGFVLKLASQANLEDAKAAVKKMETNGDLTSVFLTDPGTSKTWKDGKFGSFSGRYLAYTLTGASLNYGWNGDTLIVSTNYTGAQEAAKRTGL